MPSPFPGMNPFLEQSDAWMDFHDNFIVRIQESLNEHVGPNYLVKLEVRSVDVYKRRSIEVRDRRNRQIATVIELLSPPNKTTGSNRDDYMVKRRQILSAPTHLVEIDLRRGGTRPSPPDLPPCDYYVLVSCREDRPHVGVWPFGLREPMPTIPVPLSAPDGPIADRSEMGVGSDLRCRRVW